MADIQNNYNVRLIPFTSLTFGDVQTVTESQVIFKVTPTFSESRTVDYASVTPVHMPGGMQIYKRTNSRTFTIGAHLISRNVDDARTNMESLQKLRGWTMPYFGMTDTASDSKFQAEIAHDTAILHPELSTNRSVQFLDRASSDGIQLRGAPPDLLYLYAYSTNNNDTRNVGTLVHVNINRVPVVITSLEITYPDDVDYIPVFNQNETTPSKLSEPFPVRMDVNIQLTETHSPLEYENFNLQKYKLGILPNF